MTIDSLIAVVGVLIAIYAIMPRARQLDLLFRMRLHDWVILGAGILLIHYLLFYQQFSEVGLLLPVNLQRWTLKPNEIAYMVLVLCALVIGLDVFLFRLTPNRIRHFKRLVDELSWGNGYPELLSLLERHLTSIVQVAKDDFPLSRLRRRMLPKNGFEFFIRTHTLPRQPSWVEQRLAIFLPDRGSAARLASEVLRALMTSPEVAASIVRNRPYLGIEFLGLDVYWTRDFCDVFFWALLEFRGSIWYSEIKNNQNSNSSGDYYIPEENQLLSFLFRDAKIAHSLEVYRPVGEFMIRELDRRARMGTADEYNWAMDDFHDEGKWHSPLWTGIVFFDVMVSAALRQGITWHMWLYYYPSFVKRIVRNYSPQDVLVDETSEWPTKYSYLIYEIVRNLCGWICQVKDVPSDQENVRLKSTDPDHENSNIPKSAILALGQSCRHILLSKNVPSPFKKYILDITFRRFFDLRSSERSVPYAIALAKSLRKGGGWLGNREEVALHGEIMSAFATFDKIPYRLEHVQEFEQLILGKVR